MGSEPPTNEHSPPSPPTPPPILSLFSLPHLKPHHHHHHHHQHSVNFSSPLHTSASVPFSWEEQPGKPLPCLTLALPSTNNTTIKCLELPPRLLNDTKLTKTPSPTTVLEGPYHHNIGKSYSFRFLRKRQGSFDGSLSGGSSPERGLLGPIVLSRSRSSSSRSRRYNKGLFGSWRKRGHNLIKSKNDANGGAFVFPSFLSDDGSGTSTDNTTSSDGSGGGGGGSGGGGAPVKVRKANFLGLSPVNFWAAIYGAFKQVIPSPRKSKKWKKEAW